MIVTIKRWRTFAWPKLNWKSTKARPEKKSQEEREPLIDNFEKMAGFYADVIIKAATK